MAVFKSFEQFSRRMKAIAANVVTGSNDVKRRTALVLDRELVIATPVDTGRARSNWIVSVESPSDEIKEDYSPNYAPGPEEESIIGRAVPGQSIFVTNNLPYIKRLNEGYSAQAPAGFVESAILTASRYARTQKVLKK